jgi:hypothetical protein
VEHRIEYGGGPQDVTVTTSGPADLDSLKRVNEELVADPRFEPGMLVLIDHSALQVTELPTEHVADLGRSVRAMDDRLGRTIFAVVATTAVGYGLARLYQAYASDAATETHVFVSRDEAEEWLRDRRARIR